MTGAIGTAVELHDGLDEGEWLATRRGVITATAAAACAGSNPYYSVVQLWEEQTNPEWNPDDARNRWLDMYAANGHVAEPRIIEWASDALGVTFAPSHALVGRLQDIQAGLAEPAAATPDGFNHSRGELIEAKTAQKDWAVPPEGWPGDEFTPWVVRADDDWATSVPQHVQDQCEWQLHVTGLVTVWIALEVTKWSGRGTNKVASVVGRRLIEYRSNRARRAFLVERVEWFRGLKAEGIAPESEVDLRDLDADSIDPFDDEQADALAARVALDRIAELDEQMKPLKDERERLAAEVKTYVTGLEGRRVDAVSSKYTARLIRSWRTKTDTGALTETERRRITTWAEQETMTLVPTPQEGTDQ